MRDFNLIVPTDKAQVLSLLAEAGAERRIIAGGTGLLNLMKQRLVSPEELVSLHNVVDLQGIAISQTSIVIGALTSLADIEQDAGMQSNLPIVIETLREVANPRIRSMSTIGGAIAHGDPNQDTPVTLTALDCVVVVECASGVREVPLDQFYQDYYETALQSNELITAIRIPLPANADRFSYKKFTPGSLEDYACVSVCVRLNIDEHHCQESRIVLGGVGSTIIRSSRAEQIINGANTDDAAILEDRADEAAIAAAEDTDPVDDTRGSAEYKRRMSRVWVKRCILSASSKQ